MVGINNSIAPALTCSSLTIFSIFFKTLRPNGSQEYIPALDCLIIPARNISLCEIISASLGVSFWVGIKYSEYFMC